MKQTIRFGVFETNSSSTHSLTVCTENEYQQWKDGKLLYNIFDECFYPIEEVRKEFEEDEYYDDFESYISEDFQTYEQYGKDDYLESFRCDYTSKSGDRIIIFGKYGYNG